MSGEFEPTPQSRLPIIVCVMLIIIGFVLFWLGLRVPEAEGATLLHPLQPVIKLVEDRLERFNKEIKSYECVVHRKERIHGRLQPLQTVFMRVRQQPHHAVYMRVLGPETYAGREVLYNPQRYMDRLVVRNGGKRFGWVTTDISMNSGLLKDHTNYDVTEWGIAQGLAKIIEILKDDKVHGVCQVDYFENCKHGNRKCFAVQLTHHEKDSNFKFYKAVVLVDEELELPVHYCSYSWPEKPDEEPPLIEMLSFSHFEFNIDPHDELFSHKYIGYNFRKDFEL